MGKVAVLAAAKQTDAELSAHFGKTEWILTVDEDGASQQWIANVEATGGKVAALLKEHSCSDVIFRGIGDGAMSRLESAHIRGWFAPAQSTVAEALGLFHDGKLRRAIANAEDFTVNDISGKPAHPCCGHCH